VNNDEHAEDAEDVDTAAVGSYHSYRFVISLHYTDNWDLYLNKFETNDKQEAQLPQRDSASARRVFRLANWSCNSLIMAAVVQLCYILAAKVVSTSSAKKPSDMRSRWSFLTLYHHHHHHLLIRRSSNTDDNTKIKRKAYIKVQYTLKVICLCIIRKPLRAHLITFITNGHTSEDVRLVWH